MGKLRTFSGQAICRLLEENGFKQVRKRGSHIVMQKRTESGTVTIPIPDHKELRRGTLSSIIRQSGLPKELFET